MKTKFISRVPTDFEICAASLRILNEGNWVHKEHFNELVDEWIENESEARFQQLELEDDNYCEDNAAREREDN